MWTAPANALDSAASPMTKSSAPAADPPPPQEGDQSEVFAFLADLRAHGGTGPVKRIDTQSAAVFLAGDDAYKALRAIRLPFLDFSTLDKRRADCEAEIAANRDNAPGVYLGVTPIVRRGGGLAIGGDGEVVEWTTHMRRFDENATLDRVAERGELSPELIRDLAAAIRRSHDRAPPSDGARATRSLATYLDQNQAAFAARPDLFAPPRAAALDRESRAALAALRPLLIARGQSGRVRRCHGDLHLRNIALIDKARRALAAGQGVILDAVYAKSHERRAAAHLAAELAIPFIGLWLEAPLATRLARIGRRSGDASDADVAIAARQSAEKLAEPGWMSLEASGGLAATVTTARRKLQRSNSWLRPGDLL
jgi:hypothetical protein